MSKQSTFYERLCTLPRRRLIAMFMVIMVFIFGAIAIGLLSNKKDKVPMTILTVVQGDVEKTVTALGKMEPKDYVDVGTQVSGQLEKVHVEIGDLVKKGDLIAEIDPTTYETKVRSGKANIENLQASLVQQEAELVLARQQLTRNEELLKENASSHDTVEQNQSTLKVAVAKIAATKAQIKAAKATLDGDVANLGYTKIYAPMTGTIVSQTSLEGQTVNSSQSAPVIVRVANMETMTAWAQVAEADVIKVKAGLPVYFSTLGAPEKRWKGNVRQVYPTPETVNDVVLYNVLVDVDNSEQELMLTMTVQMFFVLDEAKNAPIVSLSALRPARNGEVGLYIAQVQTEHGIEQRNVKIGVTSRSNAAVISGLEVGDKVIMQPAETEPAGNVRSSGSGGARVGARL